MKVVVNNEGAVTVLKPLGAMLIGELEDMDERLRKMQNAWTKRIVINLAEVNCIDSAGLELLLRHHHRLNEHGLRLKLCGMNELTCKIFDLTRLSHQFEIFPDTATAIRSFV